MTTPASPLPSIPGVNVMLCGTTGTGKTHALRTLVDAGLEVFVLFTEPGMEVLADIPPEKLHWHYIAPASPAFADMISSAQKITAPTTPTTRSTSGDLSAPSWSTPSPASPSWR